MTSTAHIVPTHTAPFLVSESACPKCRWRNANERLSCSSCGLVFAKYAVRHPRQSSQGHGAREQHLPIVAIALPLPHESPRDSSGLELDWSRVSHWSRAATATTSANNKPRSSPARQSRCVMRQACRATTLSNPNAAISDCT